MSLSSSKLFCLINGSMWKEYWHICGWNNLAWPCQRKHALPISLLHWWSNNDQSTKRMQCSAGCYHFEDGGRQLCRFPIANISLSMLRRSDEIPEELSSVWLALKTSNQTEDCAYYMYHFFSTWTAAWPTFQGVVGEYNLLSIQALVLWEPVSGMGVHDWFFLGVIWPARRIYGPSLWSRTVLGASRNRSGHDRPD